MTKEEILAMAPGPELDTLVAERVMGHPMPDFIPEDALDLYLVGTPIHCDSWTCVCRYDEGDTPKWVPDPYSIDISTALKVMEKDGAWDIKRRFRPHRDDLADSGGRPTYQAICFLSDYDEYEDELVNERIGRSPWCWALPEAICKAALIAKTQGNKET